jgi:Fe-S cluster assembly scaffold protein SufB
MPTSDEILLSMQKSLEQDESIDVRKGPFFDLLRPVAGEIAPPYEEIQRVSTLYSSLADGTVDTITTTDLKTIGRNLRVTEPVGRKASTLVYFYCTTIPADTITVPAGTPVMTEDRALIYTTTGSVQVKPTNIQQYYNSKNSRYEIPVTVVAASEGSIYSIPAYRITRLGSNIAGISGVYNPSRVVGGEDAGDSEVYLNRIRTRFLGKVDSATFGITSEVQSQYGDVLLSYVQGDSKDFKRPVRGKGLDVVVPEAVTEYQEDLFVATGSNEYLLTKAPVISVESVQVDGVVQNYEFIPDETRASGGSAKGQYKIRVSASTGSSIRVRYQYCYLCNFLQTRILNAKATGYFGLDALARLSDAKMLYITAKLTASSATSGLLSSLQSEILSYVSENGSGVLSPQDLRTQVMGSHPELRVFNVVKFSTGAEEVKVLQSNGYENFQLDPNDLNITFTN